MPVGALPAGLAIRDIVGTTTGFTAVGALPVDADHDRAVALHSVDGAAWTGPYPLSLTYGGAMPSWSASALVAARNGLIAVGGTVSATPGAAFWWQSANGRNWRPLPSYPPLGPTTCTGEDCGSQPNGALVGDGHRMVALRGGSDAGVWTSSDGLTWQRLPVSGDIPAKEATQAVLLPGGYSSPMARPHGSARRRRGSPAQAPTSASAAPVRGLALARACWRLAATLPGQSGV